MSFPRFPGRERWKNARCTDGGLLFFAQLAYDIGREVGPSGKGPFQYIDFLNETVRLPLAHAARESKKPLAPSPSGSGT